jgi:3-methyladenine DNA glycosylase/8-oxoguanine DNA glycosylase
LLAWEEEALEECRTLLLDVSLHAHVSDRWVWLPDPRGGSSVCGAYQLLTIKDTPLADSAASMIWHNQVSLKAFVYIWRSLRDRLPTKSNLVTRGVISS